MVFSSPVFLFVFFPAVVLAALTAGALDRLLAKNPTQGAFPHPIQNVVLLAFSLVFYVYGSGSDIVILLASILVSWLGGLVLQVLTGARARRAALGLGIAIQLGVLAWFKYANFAVAQLSSIREMAGLKAVKWDAVALPIGISFFVFQGVSYLIDVYRRDCGARKNIIEFALFKALFPQLIAGPIVRYVHVEHELDARQVSLADVANGAVRFVFGLAKKLVIADSVAVVADAAFGVPVGELTAATAIIGGVAYTLQIYFDFSAYSDMAIGIGHMFGFRFPENFNRPLAATSITDFWRRWHITLSTWFRDYLYVPLGGSRGTPLATYRNLWIVFLASGLWHGASWTFVAWGAAHGFLLTIERMAGVKADRGPSWRRALTFVLVVLTFTLFRSSDFTQAFGFYRHMLLPIDWHLALPVRESLTHKNTLMLLLGMSTLLLPLSFTTGTWLETGSGWRVVLARFVVVTVLAVYAGGIVASSNFSPFIYFRF